MSVSKPRFRSLPLPLTLFYSRTLLQSLMGSR